jgi:hypothetical protein
MENIFKSIYCEYNHSRQGSYYTTLARCGACRRFPCKNLTVGAYREVVESPFMEISGGLFKRRKETMYLFLNTDGTITEAYSGFDYKNPNWEKLKDVSEVLVVSKVLVPQLKLVPKPVSTGTKQAAPAKRKRKAKEAKTNE